MFEFKLPDLGEGIHEGEILEWHVEVGQLIAEDEPLVDIETDKAAVQIPSPRGGRVVSLAGAVGEIVTTGQVITVIDEGNGEPAVEGPKPEIPIPTPSRPSPTTDGKPRPVPAAPATRKLARELGVDLHAVSATGPGGRVTADDVRQFAAGGDRGRPSAPPETIATPQEVDAPPSPPQAQFASPTGIPFLDLEPLPDFSAQGPVEIEPLRSIRRKVARKMVTSMVLVPHVAHMDEADITDLEILRRRARRRREGTPGGKLTLLPFVIKAVTAGLKVWPAFNASLDPDREAIVYKRFYNLGFATDTDRGLMVPVIRNTDRMSILELSAAIEDTVERAHLGQLEPDDLRGGTFTITNVGSLGGTAVVPAINYPEVAILGMGRAQEKPVVRDGEIVIRTMLPLTLSFDHRVADGAEAARFMTQLVERLSRPENLLLEA